MLGITVHLVGNLRERVARNNFIILRGSRHRCSACGWRGSCFDNHSVLGWNIQFGANLQSGWSQTRIRLDDIFPSLRSAPILLGDGT